MSGPWAEQAIELDANTTEHYLAEFAAHGSGGGCPKCKVTRCRPGIEALVTLVSAGVIPPAPSPPAPRWAQMLATPVLVLVMVVLLCGGLTAAAAVV